MFSFHIFNDIVFLFSLVSLSLANCNNTNPMKFKYTFQFLNHGGAWTRQFSYDDQGTN